MVEKNTEEKNPVGRPPMYKTPEEMQKKIDEYFESCKGELVYDAEGRPILDKNGNQLRAGARPLTITGLALALGFNSRLALIKYEDKEDFVNTVKRAKAKVEQYAEERLFDRDGVNGAKFSLSNNFNGWKEKQQIEAEVNSDVTINIELSDE